MRSAALWVLRRSPSCTIAQSEANWNRRKEELLQKKAQRGTSLDIAEEEELAVLLKGFSEQPQHEDEVCLITVMGVSGKL